MKRNRLAAVLVTLVAVSMPLAACAGTGPNAPTNAPTKSKPRQELPTYKTCVIANGAQVSVKLGAGDGSVPNHGDKVHKVVANELAARGYPSDGDVADPGPANTAIVIVDDQFTTSATNFPVGGSVTTWLTRAESFGNRSILVIDVNITSYKPEDIVTNLTALTSYLLGVRNFVFNLSFEYLPCAFFLDAAGNPLPYNPATWFEQFTASQYLQLLYAGEDAPEIDGLRQYLASPGSSGPDIAGLKTELDTHLQSYKTDVVGLKGEKLQSFLQNRADGDPLAQFFNAHGNFVPVAAAGNGIVLTSDSDSHVTARHPLPFPTAPAIFDTVVSTSASDGPTYSNAGAVKLSGLSATGDQGTSFAAPRLSVREAIYLYKLAGAPACSAQPLNYHPGWLNKDVADAVRDAGCTGFPL
jgi:hypothetical protein